jgi:hypothetical protein
MEKCVKKLEELLEQSRINDSVGWNPDCDTETLEDAIALLKAHEPVKPIRKVIGYGWRYFCGKCGNSIVAGQNFCEKCGQAVKWE